MAETKKRTKKSKVFLIEKYYEMLGDKLEWNDYKILDLCYVTRMELEELAALLRLPVRSLLCRMRKPMNRQDSLLLHQIAITKGYYAPHPRPSKI